MSIPSEQASSERLLRYARYHLAAIKADPQTEHLAPAPQADAAALIQRHRARLEAEDANAEASARLDRADFELDEACRACELEVLAIANKDRSNADYRAAFPQGLSALVAARGEVQARQVQSLVAALRARRPEVAERRGQGLEQLAEKLVATEGAAKTAKGDLSNAIVEERLTRSALVRQLHKNRAALGVIYPQSRRKVSSFFAPVRERPDDDDEGEGGDGSTDPA